MKQYISTLASALVDVEAAPFPSNDSQAPCKKQYLIRVFHKQAQRKEKLSALLRRAPLALAPPDYVHELGFLPLEAIRIGRALLV
jgi:hypothetical protein